MSERVYCANCGRQKATGNVLSHPGGCACDACEAVCWGGLGCACEAPDWRAALEQIARAWWASDASHSRACPAVTRPPLQCACGVDELRIMFDALPDSMQPEAFGL